MLRLNTGVDFYKLMEKSLDIYLFKISGLIFMLDIMFTGSGVWSDVLGLSVRKICFFALSFSSLSIWIRKKRVKKKECYAILGILFFLLLWVFFIPQIKNMSLNNSILDAQSLFGLIFLPAIASSVIYGNYWQAFKGKIYFSSVLLAIIHIVFGLMEMLYPEFGSKITVLTRLILEPMNTDGKTSVYIGYVGDMFRVIWGSSVLLLMGYYFLIKTVSNPAKKIFVFMLFCVAIYFTQSRGLLISVIVMYALMLLNHYLLYRIKFNLFTLFFLGSALVLITIPVIVLSDPDFLSSIGLDRDISDDLRSDQVRPLLVAFFDNLFWGNGFGASVDVVRSETMPWSYELSILALYMKCGIVGILFLIVCFVLFCLTEAIPYVVSNVRVKLYDLYALLFALIFASNTNPYLFNLIGYAILNIAIYW
ncbi:hypothetical protein [Methyloglobulus sp.]|uniref:hypothetical protein n=1 Tax=Methyloglobulus sp. TaxID=2518622 RepID=UPI0032B7B538